MNGEILGEIIGGLVIVVAGFGVLRYLSNKVDVMEKQQKKLVTVATCDKEQAECREEIKGEIAAVKADIKEIDIVLRGDGKDIQGIAHKLDSQNDKLDAILDQTA